MKHNLQNISTIDKAHKNYREKNNNRFFGHSPSESSSSSLSSSSGIGNLKIAATPVSCANSEKKLFYVLEFSNKNYGRKEVTYVHPTHAYSRRLWHRHQILERSLQGWHIPCGHSHPDI